MWDDEQNSKLDSAFEIIAQEIRDGAAEPPEALKAAVMAEIRRRRRRKQWAGRGVALAACLAFVVISGLRFGLFSGDSPAGTSLSSSISADAGQADTPFVSYDSMVGASQAEAPAAGGVMTSAPDTTAAPEFGAAPMSSPAPDQSYLFGLRDTALYVNAGSGLYEPLKNLDDSDVAFLMEFLNLQKIDDVPLPTAQEPNYVLEVKQPDGSMTQRSFWIADGVLYCDSPDDAYIYMAACDPAKFITYVQSMG